jgi:polyisoprenoid-binding protein YceI
MQSRPRASTARSVFAGLAAAALLTSGSALAAPAKFTIDPAHLSIGFMAAHIGYAKTLGFFRKAEGAFTFDEETGALTELEVVVDTGSVFTNHEERDKHLQSRDFLNTRSYPQMVFTASSARRTGEHTFTVDGELSLLGVTKPLTLEATVNKAAEYPIDGKPYVMGVSATGVVKRSEFGMSYGVDNGWVGDEVTIIVEFEARRQ